MYVMQKNKLLITIVLIFVFTFVSTFSPIMMSNSYAAVAVGGGLSLKALWIAISGIAAGLTFTSPQGLTRFAFDAENALRDMGWSFPGDVSDIVEEAEDILRGFPPPPNPKDPPNKPPQLPKLPNLPSLKNMLMNVGGKVMAGNLLNDIIDWLMGNDRNGVNIYKLGDVTIYPKNSSDPHPGQLQIIAKGGYYDSWDSYFIFYKGIDQFTDVNIEKFSKVGEPILDPANSNPRYIKQKVNIVCSAIDHKNGKKKVEHTFDYTLRIAIYDSQNSTTYAPEKTVPSVTPPTLPDGVTKVAEPNKNDKPDYFPLVLPRMPSDETNINDVSWEDYGFDTKTITIPGTTIGPDGLPVPIETKIPLGFPPGYSNEKLMEQKTGVMPEDLVGLDKAGLNQWLQNNIHNITNINNSTINNPDLDIQDGPIDIIDFDFSPLRDLGGYVVRKFPFCIPFDLVDSIKLIAGKSEAPKIAIEIDVKDSVRPGTRYKNKLDINIEQFESLAFISRIAFTLIFIVSLMFVTSRTIKW